MVFIAGEKLFSEMISTESGLWLIRPDDDDSIAVVVKLPAFAIKEIYRGVSTFLVMAVMEIDRLNIRALRPIAG